jgi:hypothetical protein
MEDHPQHHVARDSVDTTENMRQGRRHYDHPSFASVVPKLQNQTLCFVTTAADYVTLNQNL